MSQPTNFVPILKTTIETIITNIIKEILATILFEVKNSVLLLTAFDEKPAIVLPMVSCADFTVLVTASGNFIGAAAAAAGAEPWGC
jgi:hypothetical protein